MRLTVPIPANEKSDKHGMGKIGCFEQRNWCIYTNLAFTYYYLQAELVMFGGNSSSRLLKKYWQGTDESKYAFWKYNKKIL